MVRYSQVQNYYLSEILFSRPSHVWNVLDNKVENFPTSDLHTFPTLLYQYYSQPLGSLSNKDRYGNGTSFKKVHVKLVCFKLCCIYSNVLSLLHL